MKNRYLFLALLFIVLAWGYVSKMDYEDGLREQQYYCDMVKAHNWPDYEGKNHDCS